MIIHLRGLLDAARWVDAALNKRSPYEKVITVHQAGDQVTLEAVGIDDCRSARLTAEQPDLQPSIVGLPAGALVTRLAMLRGKTVTVTGEGAQVHFEAGRSSFTLAAAEAGVEHRAAAVRDQSAEIFRADADQLRTELARISRFTHPKSVGRWESTIGVGLVAGGFGTGAGDQLLLQAGGSSEVARIVADVTTVVEGIQTRLALPVSLVDSVAAMTGTVTFMLGEGRVVVHDESRIAVLPLFDLQHPKLDTLFKARDDRKWSVESAALAAALPLLVVDDQTVTIGAGEKVWTMSGSDAKTTIDVEQVAGDLQPARFKVDGNLLMDALELGDQLTISEPKPILVVGDGGEAAIAPIRN